MKEEPFHPDVLDSLLMLARNMTKGAENPFEAHVWSWAWLALLEALEGEGLNLEPLSDLAEYLNVGYISEEAIIAAEREAEILQARAKSGECLRCGRIHDSEDKHLDTPVN